MQRYDHAGAYDVWGKLTVSGYSANWDSVGSWVSGEGQVPKTDSHRFLPSSRSRHKTFSSSHWYISSLSSFHGHIFISKIETIFYRYSFFPQINIPPPTQTIFFFLCAAYLCRNTLYSSTMTHSLASFFFFFNYRQTFRLRFCSPDSCFSPTDPDIYFLLFVFFSPFFTY